MSNTYHRYRPIGQGYEIWSSGQLLQIDYLKTNMGAKFDYHEIIDNHYKVDPAKLKVYSKRNGLNLLSIKNI
jgi:hypothetical protein